jgi:MFS family permease
LFGALKLQMPLQRLLLLGAGATALTTLPLLSVGTLPALAAAVLLAGLSFAPTMIVAMSLVEQRVPEWRLTEGMTWLLAGLNIGVALGAALSGQSVDAGGVRSGFFIALVAGSVVLLVALLAQGALRTSASSTPSAGMVP